MTAKDARLAVFEVLDVSAVQAIATKVWDHETVPGGLKKPLAVTVASAGMTATDYRVYVRVYSDTSDNVQRAQDGLDDLMDACEAALEADGTWPRSSWDIEWSEPHNAFIATCILEVPREDF